MSKGIEKLNELIPGTELVLVQVDTVNNAWKVVLHAEASLNKELLMQVEQYFYNNVPGLTKIEFKITKKLTDQEIKHQLSDIWSVLKDEIKKNVPAANGWLEKASYQYSSGKLIITVTNNLGLKLLQQRRCDNNLANKFYELTGSHPKIELLCSGGEQGIPVWQEEAEKHIQKQIKQKNINVSSSSQGTTAPVETGVFIGRKIKGEPVFLSSIDDEEKQMIVQGRVFGVELRELRSGRNLLIFNITDNTDSLNVKMFLEKDKVESALAIKNDCWVKARGPIQHDKYTQELTMMAYDINSAHAPQRMDNAENKRVELHLHTQMSPMDSVMSASAAIKQAAKWGHAAVAITDHGVLQSYPEAASAAQKNNIKVIYGVEGYLVDDGKPVVENAPEISIDESEYVVFDLETTGLHPRTDEIIEIGAVKMQGLDVVDQFSTMVKPTKVIPAEVVKLTGITSDMVDDAPSAAEALKKFQEFIGGSVLVAHNAAFDVGFTRLHLNKHLDKVLGNAVLDTMTMARLLYPNLKNHKLKTLCKEFDLRLENHHRAVDDAVATAQLFKIFLEQCQNQGIVKVAEINDLIGSGGMEKLKPYHVTILAKNQQGLKNLYKLITHSHLKYYYRNPRIPKSILSTYRKGLLIGSACEAGELFRALVSGEPEDKVESIASFYDYLEIQPLGNSQFLIESGQLRNEDQLKEVYKNIYKLGQKLGKPVVATGDVHFLNPEDEVYRRILLSGKGFDDADNQPPLYFKTTDEMLMEFKYLGNQSAYEVVVENSIKINDMVEKLQPIPQETYHPKIEGAEQQITDMSEEKARELYGDQLPQVVRERLDKELKSIIGNGFAVLYLTAQKLVKKSNDDGYLVGSRGSVGSSLVATFTGITEVNPLPAHYRCPGCKHSEFVLDGSYACGADMPDETCPSCGTQLVKDGQDIPFEVFLGFDGDKIPDIDLNFSGDYQSRAQKYTEVLFGKDNVFKAGTIGTIADKTAYGFVKKYLDEKGIVKREAEINRLVSGCTGVKRTTGQHPGGIMVVPKNIDVHDVTPLQHPADDKKSGIITTHFDYHAIHDCLVKLDILGHDDPTAIKMLEDLTGVDARTIPLDDKDTLALFSGTEVLNVKPKEIRSQVGTYAIPEFGTKFVRQMLVDTKPTTFSELVRISGFSHGTDVWLNNAQDLIRSGVCQLSEAISARDDIMIYLIHKGLPPKKAFKIMEKVRKGKGVTDEEADLMLENDVPEWYLESCRKIKYMFPKAHAVAYVMMAFRIAWFKVNYPMAFYATYFTVRADDFDAHLIAQGQQVVLQTIEDIEEKGVSASPKEKSLLTILEVALEMYARDYTFKRVSLEESDASRFLIKGDKLLPPLGSLQGVGEAAAHSIAMARDEAPFTSIEDLRLRAKVSKTVIETLKQHGCLEGMEETNQLSLF